MQSQVQQTEKKKGYSEDKKYHHQTKNVTNTKSDCDIQKSGEENSQQPVKFTINSLGISESQVNSNEQKKTNTTQDQRKPDTDDKRAEKYRGPFKVKTKTELQERMTWLKTPAFQL